MAACVWRDVVSGGLGLQAGVGGGNGEAADTHDGQVDHVVAHVGELVEGDVGFGEDVADSVHLVRLPLVDELEPQVPGADGDSGGLALGDDADAQATEAREGDAEAVVGGEALDLQAILLAVGGSLRDEE